MNMTQEQFEALSTDLSAVTMHLELTHCTECCQEAAPLLMRLCGALYTSLGPDDIESDVLYHATNGHLHHLIKALDTMGSKDAVAYETIVYLNRIFDLISDEQVRRALVTDAPDEGE